MDIIERARKLEAVLSRTMEHVSHLVAPGDTREPLETLDAIVNAVVQRVEPAGRGTFVFPFNRITAEVLAASPEEEIRTDAVFRAGPSLEERILARLRDARCDVRGLAVTTVFVATPRPDWTDPTFAVRFDRANDAAPVVAVAERPVALELTVVSGDADQPVYRLRLARINIGRCAEVRDRANRLLRVNHVAFADRADASASVSRQHAHIDHIATTDEYRLCDDRSGHGTSVIRQGRTIPVPSGPRGIRLLDGDEIVMGEAKLRASLQGGRT